MLRKILFVSFALACALTSYAQTFRYNQVLYWTRYQVQLFFPKNWSWNNDIDNRRFLNPDVQNQLIFHSRVHHRKDKWDFAGGLTYSLAYAAIPENGYKYGNAELRPVIETTYEIPFLTGHLSHRIRIDNRIFQEEQDKNLFEESFYVMRLRYRVQCRFPLIKNNNNITTVGIRFADEIMVNAQGNFYDQNRIYLTGEFYINKSFSLEGGYIYIDQQRYRREEFFSRHVLRFSVLHRINL